jgi:hypothetical protein
VARAQHPVTVRQTCYQLVSAGQIVCGLIGSPRRDIGLQEMNKLFDAPDFPISELFLTAMSILPLDPNEPAGSLRKQRDENLKALRQRLVSALPNKRGTALAISVGTAMLGMGPNMPAEIKAKLISQLIQVFPTLPLEKQLTWVYYRWQQVKCPEWLPLLRTLALHYEDVPELREMHAYESLQLSGAAPTHWYELDPEGARSAVMTEITRPKPRYNATVLGLLPDQILPQVEHIVAAHLLETDNYEIVHIPLKVVKEAADEFHGFQGHDLQAFAVLRISPTKADAIVSQTHQPAIGDCDPSV